MKTQTRLNRDSAFGSRRRQALKAALAGAAGAGLAACGGGAAPEQRAAADADADVDATADDRRRILGVDSGGTGIQMSYLNAVVTAVNPLVAAGVQFDIGQARIVDADGNALTATELAPGMSTTIEAVASGVGQDQALAKALVVGEQLLGPVDSVDLASSRVVVLGQQVQVTSDTRFADELAGRLAGLRTGDGLRIWGQLDVFGARIVATRIDVAPANVAFVVRGLLTQLDRSNGRLAIGALQASAQPELLMQAGTDVAVGAVVRARLQPLPGQAPAPLLSIRGDAVKLPARSQVEIEGRVTRVVSDTRFDVDGIEVEAVGASWTPAGVRVSAGARVHVEGRSANGQLVAASVEVESDDALVELEGTVTSVDRNAMTFVLRGSTVAWSATTVFVGGTSTLIAPRRRVAVKGRPSLDRSRLEATRIHVER